MRRNILTTYDISKYCEVSFMTVIDWVNQGKLPAYKTPGGHRRIKKDDLVTFLKKHEMPIHPDLKHKVKKILVVDDEPNIVNVILELRENDITALGDADRKRIQLQIASCERQIDRIVYMLYGLTDEEIAIVEESVKR